GATLSGPRRGARDRPPLGRSPRRLGSSIAIRENGPTLTPALSLRQGEGAPVHSPKVRGRAGSVPSPPEGERVAFRAEPLAPSGEARAEMVRGRTKRGEEH